MSDTEHYPEGMGSPEEPRFEAERSTGQIEREIERTRGRMSRDIDELGERLSPRNLKEEAKEAINEKAREVADSVTARARYTGYRVVNFIQENPSLVAAMGLGAVWLVQQRNRGPVSGDRMARYAYTGPERRALRERIGDRYTDVHGSTSGVLRAATERIGDIRDRAEDAMERTQQRVEELGQEGRERVRELGESARAQVRRARGQLERAMDEKPLVVVAAAAILGLAVGFLVEESGRERRLMGAASERLKDRVQHTATRFKDAAIEAGHDVGDQIKESAERVMEETKQASKETT